MAWAKDKDETRALQAPDASEGPYSLNIRQLLSSPLARNLAAVIGGTATAQAVILIFSPLITRIYSPEIFGIQGIFLALISILWPIAALRYPTAIVVADSEAEVRGLVRLSLWIAATTSCVIALALFGFRQPLLALLGIEEVGPLVWFLPLALFLVALQDTMDFRAARLGTFRVVGVVTILHAFLVNALRAVGGLLQPIAATLTIITSLSYGLQALMLRFGIRRHLASSSGHEAISSLFLFKKYRDFPIYRMPADLINAVSQTFPVFLVSILFSPAGAGLFVLARSVVNLPLNLISAAVGNVFYASLADRNKNNEPLFPFVLKATLIQLLIPGAMTILVVPIFPSVFALAFGDSWRTSGHIAQWMSLLVVGMLVNIPASRALPVIESQNLHLIFNLLIMIGGFFGMLIGYKISDSIVGSVAGYSSVTATVHALQTVAYIYRIRRYDRNTGFV